jgi:hypothetical protein
LNQKINKNPNNKIISRRDCVLTNIMLPTFTSDLTGPKMRCFTLQNTSLKDIYVITMVTAKSKAEKQTLS